MSRMSEAQKCVNTLGLLSNKSAKGNIDMNIVAKSDLNFHGVSLTPVDSISGVWLTSSDIAKALGYASSKSVSTIYSRNSDEFTSSMSMVIKMKTIAINNNLREKSVRVFSLRGCHLIAMFATTDKAKEFRRWVLDILDREVAKGTVPVKFDFELYAQNANAACAMLDQVWDIFHDELEPALRSLASPVATKLVGRIIEAKSISYSIRGGLLRAAGDGKGRIH
ncbi:BRO-N domain-containing protein [Atlantibacter hermannii]|uniref:BRO-N domain-containing protein n=1 Tax=Atlantibacter hermannii TaxID=565 RepID=UPI0028B0834B|nr:BRO family protein [Atlantibacter hermannii]